MLNNLNVLAPLWRNWKYSFDQYLKGNISVDKIQQLHAIIREQSNDFAQTAVKYAIETSIYIFENISDEKMAVKIFQLIVKSCIFTQNQVDDIKQVMDNKFQISLKIDNAILFCILEELEKLNSTQMEYEGKESFQQLFQNTQQKCKQTNESIETLQNIQSLQYQTEFTQLLIYQLTEQLHEFSEIQINNTDFSKPLLPYFSQLQTMLFTAVLNSIESIVQFNRNQVEHVLKDKISEQYTLSISNKIFDLVLFHPDTQYLLMEFSSNSKINTNELWSRLFKQGVTTINIIKSFLNTLKVLQIIDKNGQMFEKVVKLFKDYLLKRKDCLRSIIEILTTDNENNKLTNEKLWIPSGVQIQVDEDSSEEESTQDQMEIEDKKRISGIKYVEKDLFSFLVNFYGSNEGLMNEYQFMLAQKIICARDFKYEEEIKAIEYLKKRFDENIIQPCLVILRDYRISKKLNQDFHQEVKMLNENGFNLTQLHPIIVSKGYWFLNYSIDTLTLPEPIKEVFKDYSVAFESKKQMQRLNWQTHLGYVTLDLTFDNGEFQFKCLPIHALLISYFDESNLDQDQVISSELLAKELSQDHLTIKRRMMFWIQKGVIREVKNNTDDSNESSFYFPVKVLENQGNNAEEDLYEEEIDQIFEKNRDDDWKTIQNIRELEQAILKIIRKHGSCVINKITILITTLYKDEVSFEVKEQHVKEILKLMINKKMLECNTREMYVIPILPTQQ